MQDNFIDEDFGRVPGAPRPDYDAAMEEHRRDFENTSDDDHARHEERARAMADTPIAKELFDTNRTALIVDDPEDVRRIEQAVARDAEKAAEKAAEDAAKLATSGLPGAAAGAGASEAAGGSSNGANTTADAGKTPGADKPTELESTLANIRLNGDRQRRLVISGDKAIEAAFYAKLAERKQVYYQAGVPIITISRAKAIQVLQETAREFEGAGSSHALSVQLDRDGGGVLGNIKAGIANNLPGFLSRRHEIDVVVVGKPDVVEAKLKELGSFVTAMERNGHIPEGAAPLKDGKLVPAEGQPVKLDGTARLYDVWREVNTKVVNYNAEQSAKQQELREFRDQEKLKDIADAKAKANPGSAKEGSERINEHAEKLVAKIDQAFKDPDLLHAHNGKGQVAAEVLLRQARGLGDPSVRELQTLPEADRQKAIVQLASIVAKADNKEFDLKGEKKDQHLSDKVDHREQPGTSTLREKVDALVTMEAARDADFGAKAQPLLKDLVERKFLTESQAEALTGRIAEAVAAAKEAGKTEDATKAPASEATQAKEGDKEASAPAPAADTALAKEAGKEGDTKADTPAATAEAPAAKESGKEATAEADAGTVKPDAQAAANAAADSSKPETTAQDTSKTADATAKEATPQAAAAQAGAEPRSTSEAQSGGGAHSPETAAPGTSLRATLDAAFAHGPEAMTSANARAVITELEARKDQPLSALAHGERPSSIPGASSTLEQVKIVLLNASAGQFGDELAAKATALHPAVQEWTKHENERIAGVKAEHAALNELEATRLAAPASTEKVLPVADKPLELRDRIEALAKDGTAGLTEKKADALVTDLDGIRSKSLSALDAGSGEKPTQTLVRAEALLKEVESGRFGPELQARAKDLSDALQKWGQQDGARLDKDGVQRDAVVSQLKAAEPALHAGAQASRAETGAPAQQAADAAKAPAAQEPAKAPAQPSAEQVAREQAAQRLWETESAGAKLAGFMANPAGSFTNRDKSWNEENIQRAAREALRIDPEAVSQLSAAQRTKIAAYSAWVADNARSGKLPGFSSEEGKAVANQLVERAAALIGKMDEGSKIPPDVQKTLAKAENMVNAKEQLEKTASLSNQTVREGSSRSAISPAAANALSTDMVHAAYGKQEVRDAQVKYLLKNASNLTPQSLQSLDPQAQAKTAVAMSHLAQQVRDGAMGDFSKLPSTVQKNVLATAQAADNLLNSMSKDPAMRTELNKAYNELHGKSTSASHGSEASAAKPTSNEQSSSSKQAEAAVAKQEGRSLDR